MRMMSFQACFCLVGYGYMVLTLDRALVGFGMWPCIWWGATSCSIWEFDCKNINITLWKNIYFYTCSYPSICVGFWQVICFKIAMYRQNFQILLGYIQEGLRVLHSYTLPVPLPTVILVIFMGSLWGALCLSSGSVKWGGFFSGGKRHWHKVGPYQ